MGREIRIVPPNWEHPRNERGHLQPMFDRTFADAAAEWKAEFAKWEAGERPEYCDDAESRALEYWEWSGEPPDRAYYRPWSDAEAAWFQLWETVSEGTPVSPPFATREELAVYLAENGDFWDQKRGHHECPGYDQDPQVGQLWPDETSEEFGYPVRAFGSDVERAEGTRP